MKKKQSPLTGNNVVCKASYEENDANYRQGCSKCHPQCILKEKQ